MSKIGHPNHKNTHSFTYKCHICANLTFKYQICANLTLKYQICANLTFKHQICTKCNMCMLLY